MKLAGTTSPAVPAKPSRQRVSLMPLEDALSQLVHRHRSAAGSTPPTLWCRLVTYVSPQTVTPAAVKVPKTGPSQSMSPPQLAAAILADDPIAGHACGGLGADAALMLRAHTSSIRRGAGGEAHLLSSLRTSVSASATLRLCCSLLSHGVATDRCRTGDSPVAVLASTLELSVAMVDSVGAVLAACSRVDGAAETTDTAAQGPEVEGWWRVMAEDGSAVLAATLGLLEALTPPSFVRSSKGEAGVNFAAEGSDGDVLSLYDLSWMCARALTRRLAPYLFTYYPRLSTPPSRVSRSGEEDRPPSTAVHVCHTSPLVLSFVERQLARATISSTVKGRRGVVALPPFSRHPLRVAVAVLDTVLRDEAALAIFFSEAEESTVRLAGSVFPDCGLELTPHVKEIATGHVSGWALLSTEEQIIMQQFLSRAAQYQQMSQTSL